MHKEYAKQIIDTNFNWKTNEKVQENVRMPIIVYNTEWDDENSQINSNEYPSKFEYAQDKYSDKIEYQHVKINFLSQSNSDFENQDNNNNNNDKITLLSNDSDLIQQQNISINHETNLSQMSSNHNSQTSSFLDMEIFLNHFENALDQEQHLPFIDQISLSYTMLNNEQDDKSKNSSLSVEWFKSNDLSYDEQLVEQWIVVNDTDTIQQEGTLHRKPIKLLTNNEYKTRCINDNFSQIVEKEKKNSSNVIIDKQDNYYINDVITYCSPTNDYEIDSVDRDNNTMTSTINSTLIIPLTSITNILPSSSITNTTLSSTTQTFYKRPFIPVVYFLDALANEQTETYNLTKNFLLTIGFGQNKIKSNNMKEVKNTIATFNQPLRPRWINLSSNFIEILPTIIHHDQEHYSSSNQNQLYFPIENQIEPDHTALLIYPYRLKYGHDFDENIQEPLNAFVELSYLHLPVINEIHTYQLCFHRDFAPFRSLDTLPHVLSSKFHDNEVFSLNKDNIRQQQLLSFAQIHTLSDNHENIQTISFKFDQPNYIEHYYIQSLFPFPEICYAQVIRPDIILDNNTDNLLTDFLSITYTDNEVKWCEIVILYAFLVIYSLDIDPIFIS